MAFSSGTKSWKVCSKDQRRECMAFAAFTKLKEMLGAKEINEIISKEDLLAIINRFKWSGGSSKQPHGKSEAEVGLSDDLLDKLFILSKADALLTSWLQSADRAWKKAIEPEIAKRKKESEKLKKQDPKSSKVRFLEGEIKKLEDDWTL